MTMERHIHALFPVPLGSYRGFAQHAELIEYVGSALGSANQHHNAQDLRLSHYFDRGGKGFLDQSEPLVGRLKQWILQCAHDYVATALGLDCDQLFVASSWLNRCDIGGGQAPHSHENSLISGTYYLNFSHGHAPIRFWRPAASGVPNSPYLSLMPLQAERQTAFSAPEIQIAPVAGSLLLWPSHLLHGYSGNELDNRLTLSFNLLPRRLMGSSYSLEIVDPQAEIAAKM